ncbi:MAG: hypothetical protein K2O31_03795 [Clostridia bacterium]|nr:hypothetical protein [Clostridia bacterium]MDE6210523.1 hypothetical protein [Clostridia bacterium]MDE6604909.1 hypothetical protein [Clostridia bacterium]MDE6869423.1 hypothetical protein [Clostridia bacterium]MDE7208983.1 hypothetical protein [Clostridia bacterium]
MDTKNSAILQMIRGERGNIENIEYSDEYKEAKKLSIEAQERFIHNLDDYPQLQKLYFELDRAIGYEYSLHLEEVYKEAFSFGLSLGKEAK